MVQKNVGTVNALIRITCGLTAVSYGTARLVKKAQNGTDGLLILMGAMKVAEGIVRYCPVTDMIDNTQMGQNLMQGMQQQATQMTQQQNQPNSQQNQTSSY
ncbi:DUF2892 domain-containing protein [Virgibacillus sp. MSP4-1]|uniref:YgaP family membrane protein n=1 Tax=Virgibacillus sp. MSP4-1 TaxID=2700081 RepID=UPI0003A72A6F|nr:DUF2892 domain-containing protein [Virgibacillus sp. MSP4-1]QHS24183.1 DUF2892 domain-containing protein [Virgibacillus sp. MSP4-1]